MSAITFAQQKKYVSYTVKKGETIKTIAKDYGLTTRDLLKLNPGVKRKPKENTVIIVPNKNYSKDIIKVQETVLKDDFYEVKPKETLYGISKKFGITVEDLIAENPSLKHGLKEGMKIKIPKPKNVEKTETYLTHTVVKDDTVYNLTKRYQVSVEELYKLNPALVQGLKLGMVLKIKPVSDLENDENTGNEEEMPIDEDTVFHEFINTHKSINVVVMLPYKLNEVADSLVVNNFKKENSLLNIVTDIHMGIEMAIDSLSKKGAHINVNYFDTENSESKLKSIVNSTNFDDVDVVLGPLYFENAHWLAKQIDAPVIAPVFSKKQLSLSTSNLVKSAPEEDLLQNTLLDYLKEHYKGENIIVVNDGKTDSQSKLWKVVNILKSFDSVQEISVIKPEKGYIAKDKIASKLKSESKNWVILISEEALTTAATVNNLKVMDENFDITLIAFDKGKNFDKIDNNFLGELKFMFPTTEFLDNSSSEALRFYKKFQVKNNTIPSKYALRGFDVAYDVLARMATFDDLTEGLKAGKSTRISSVFDYDKKLFGSFENKGAFIIQYDKDLNSHILE